MTNLFVFDVEATSLHGSGFAVGAVVYNEEKKEIVDKICLLSREGRGLAGEWVQQNVIPYLTAIPEVETDLELREEFFKFYMKWKGLAEIWSDVNYPVETNFLSAIVADDIEGRQWSMPYPLKDIATIVDVSLSRADIHKSETGEDLAAHNPLNDAIASLTALLSVRNK